MRARFLTEFERLSFAFSPTRIPNAARFAAFVVVWLTTCLNGAIGAQVTAEHPFVHPLFSDHIVLQRGVKVPIWGWAQPGTRVTVSFGGQEHSATAGPGGKWIVHLRPMKASAQPRSMTIQGSGSGENVTISDVLVGDVWLCSGQSNMEMGIANCNVPDEIATANYPEIRLLTVPHLVATKPVEVVECRWLPCTPTNVLQGLWGGFSAAGYFFGRDLYRELNVPIGLIHSSWGGTIAEAWTSAQGLDCMPEFSDAVNAVAQRDSAKPYDFSAEYKKWCEKTDPGTKENWAKADLDSSSWKQVSMPQPFEQAGLPDFDGMVWFRREFDLPSTWQGQKLTLGLGPIDDIDTTFVNGVKVGQMNRYDQNRVYSIPATALKPGKNVIAVRVMDTGGNGGLTGRPEQLFIKPASDNGEQPISLAGVWSMRDSAPLSKLSGMPTAQDGNNPNVVTVLYNGMIAPILPFAIKGAIWYQGESNADRAYQYRTLLPAMIRDWRKRFEVGDFPFYIVQLASFLPTFAEPRDNTWAELREAQALTAQKVPHCGLALAIDIGEANDIHPKNKAEVGRRLALCALAKTYGKKIEYSGPWYKSMKVAGDSIRLRFDHVDGGLEAKGGDLKGFAIAGEDHHFVWADARIEGDTVVVSSSQVSKPIAVRYAWDINPVCNLYNRAGLPAVPFRTDNWQMLTHK
jgi:sialate O-acetylesterase